MTPVIPAVSSIIYDFKNGFSQKGLGNKGRVYASLYCLKILSNVIHHLILKMLWKKYYLHFTKEQMEFKYTKLRSHRTWT